MTNTTAPITATRIASRFFEYVDGEFNVDAEAHRVDVDELTFETPAELVDAIRRDGCTFAATGADWAADPDGSFVVDYATAEREAVSWHLDNVGPATAVVLAVLVDA